jgi:hypothetical protein
MDNDSIEQLMRLLNINMQNVFSQGESETVEPDQSTAEIRDVAMLNHIISEYNNNMTLYHANIRSMLDLLRHGIRDRRNAFTRRTMRPAATAQRTSVPRNDYTFLSYLLNNPLVSGIPSDATENNGITPAQMRHATRIIQYDASMNEVRCPICLEDFQEGENICQIIQCGHIFKESELTRWFERHSVCPVCRCDVVSRPTAQRRSTPYQFTFEIPVQRSNTFRFFDRDLSYNNVD